VKCLRRRRQVIVDLVFSIVWPVDVAAAINAFAIESLDLVTVREVVGGVARRAGLPSCRKRRLRPGLESGTKFRAQRPYPDRRIGVKLYKTETMLTAPLRSAATSPGQPGI
jgi:hypothetical protein